MPEDRAEIGKDIKFKVAVVAAGELRSFSFVEYSWRRYMFDPWEGRLFLFAHAIRNQACPFAVDGAQRLRHLATEYELASPAPYISSTQLKTLLPDRYKSSDRWKKLFGNFVRGNFIDMHARRARAYELARDYALRHSFEWDLIVFIRFDTAIYNPIFDFYKWHLHILQINQASGSKGIFIPGGNVVIPHVAFFVIEMF